MKALLALVSCHSREDFSDAIRNTWLPLAPRELDVKFFRGRGAKRPPKEDEVFLDCGDAYLDLPEKVKAIVTWAYDNGYDYVAKVDDDVVVKPKEWYEGFSRADFSGWRDPGCKPGEIGTPWGFFYVMSRKSMELIKKAPLPGREGSTHNYVHGNDEAWISTILHCNSVFLHSDNRYFLYLGERPKETNPRPLRAPKRLKPPIPKPTENWFATCVYLNWTGWHNTGPEAILREFHRIFREGHGQPLREGDSGKCPS